MWIRIFAFFVGMLVMRRAEAGVVKDLTSSETDDLLDRLSSDREMPRWARLLAKIPWLYRQSPIDLIPDVIPFIGRIDDKMVTSFSLSLLARLSPRHLFERNLEAVRPPAPIAPARRRRWFSR